MKMNAKQNLSIPFLGVIIWSLAALFFLYEFFLRTFVGTLAPQIMASLHLDAETFSIIGSAYYITYGLMQIPVGILADKWGIKKVLVFAASICAAATYYFSIATGFENALIARLLMGFGSSFAFVCLLVIATTWFPRKFFGFFVGLSQFVGTLGPLLAGGPFMRWMIAMHGNWRAMLSIVSLFGFILACLFLLIMKNKPRGGEQAFIYLRPHYSIKRDLGKLLKNGQAWCIAVYSATIYISIVLLGVIWGTEFLESHHLNPSTAADIISLSWLSYAIGCPLTGAISDMIKRRRPMMILCAVLGLVSTVLLVYGLFDRAWIYGLLFIGVGLAASGQNVGFAIIAEQAEIATRATALGLNNGMITLFGSFVPPIASYFIDISAHGSSYLSAANFKWGFSVMPVFYLVGVILVCFFIKETFCKPQKEAILLRVI